MTTGTGHDCVGIGSPTRSGCNRSIENRRKTIKKIGCDLSVIDRIRKHVDSRQRHGRGGRHEWSNGRRHGYPGSSDRWTSGVGWGTTLGTMFKST